MFRRLTERFYASPQISPADVGDAAARGVTLIINNRPEGESDDQAPGEVIAAEAERSGIGYVAIPVTHAGFNGWQIEAMADALKSAPGPVLAYCRSGTRSTLLWALTEAKEGADIERLATQAAEAGYDLSPIRQMMDVLASKTS